MTSTLIKHRGIVEVNDRESQCNDTRLAACLVRATGQRIDRVAWRGLGMSWPETPEMYRQRVRHTRHAAKLDRIGR